MECYAILDRKEAAHLKIANGAANQDVYVSIPPLTYDFTLEPAEQGMFFFVEATHMDIEFRKDFKTAINRLPKENVLPLMLKLVGNSPNPGFIKRRSLAYKIFLAIGDMAIDDATLGNVIDTETRMTAFNLVFLSPITKLKLIVMNTYQLYRIKRLVVYRVKELLDQGLLSLGIFWVVHLKLSESFDIYDALVPFLLTNQMAVIEKVMYSTPSYIYEFADFLDSLFHRNKTIPQILMPLINTRYSHLNVQFEELTEPKLLRSALRFMKKFVLDTTRMPNLYNKMVLKRLKKIYSDYDKGFRSRKNYREQIKELIASEILQLQFAYHVGVNEDAKEFYYWCAEFELKVFDNDQQPPELSDDESDEDDEVEEREESSSDDDSMSEMSAASSDVFDLIDKNTRIKLVSSNCDFINMLKCLYKHNYIYMHSQSNERIFDTNNLSFILIATDCHVFMVDCAVKRLTYHVWMEFINTVYYNDKICKVVYGLHQLQKVFKNLLPYQHLREFDDKSLGFLDMKHVIEEVKKLNLNITLPYCRFDDLGTKLKHIIFAIYGKIYDDKEKDSNWLQRPLRKDQIDYIILKVYTIFLLHVDLVREIRYKGQAIKNNTNPCVRRLLNLVMPKENNCNGDRA